MFDGNDRRHTVTHICTGEICILFLQNSKLAGILIHNGCKNRLETGNMRAALCIVNIVAESHDILMKFIRILKSRLYGNTFALTLEINHIMKHFRLFVQVADKADDSFLFMIHDMLRFFSAKILIYNCQLWIQISCLMQTAFYLILLKPCFFKNLRIRKKIDFCSCFFCFSNNR